MSELITPRRTDFRWQLLTTVSALSLLGVAISQAKAEDTGRPTVWIELGGQLERADGSQQQFIPPFIANSPRASVWTQSPANVERPSRYAFGGEAKITFEPRDMNWVFTASARYGRSNGSKSISQQSNIPTLVPYGAQMVPPNLKLSDSAQGQNTESHTILNFMAGKDVGLGMFGSKSVINFGIRFAQFDTKSSVTMKSRQTLGAIKHVSKFGGLVKLNYYYPRNYDASANDERGFHGIGPSLSWDASAPVAGNVDATELTFDWGLNAAVLFGRQKVRAHHQTIGRYISMTGGVGGKYTILSSYDHPHDRTHSRSVIVPNVGGFAGVSFKFPNAKVSMGYRADFFFNAMDGGLDTAKSYNRAFYGPFATISIGLGG